VFKNVPGNPMLEDNGAFTKTGPIAVINDDNIKITGGAVTCPLSIVMYTAGLGILESHNL
jgi:hypothetical protein